MHLTTEPFTVENDLMTPSYKLKRAPLHKRYKKQVRTHAPYMCSRVHLGGTGRPTRDVGVVLAGGCHVSVTLESGGA